MRFRSISTIVSYYLEGFFWGLYSGIFFMYLKYRASQKDANKWNNILFYALCLLYVLSVASFASDLVETILVRQPQVVTSSGPPVNLLRPFLVIQPTLFACCDFIAQAILIYRCWIVWGQSIGVIILPLILAFAFLVIWIVSDAAAASRMYIDHGQIFVPPWNPIMTVIGLAVSMIVNALVTGLLVFRILKVFREVKATSDERVLGAVNGSALRRVIFILIESGMVLFSVQLVRLLTVCLTLWATRINNDGVYGVYNLLYGIHKMLNGITPTIILVRVSTGFSFHDKKSMMSISSGIVNNLNLVPETASPSTIAFADRDEEMSDESRLTAEVNG